MRYCYELINKNKLFQESQKLAKKVSSNVQETNEKLAPKIKAAYDDFAKNTQEVIKKIQEAANAKQ